AMSARQGRQLAEGTGYFAGALSLVFHSAHPLIPTFRSDIRYFQVDGQNGWFGGGADLTPSSAARTRTCSAEHRTLFDEQLKHSRRTEQVFALVLMSTRPFYSSSGEDSSFRPPSLVWADFDAPPELPPAPAPSPPTSPASHHPTLRSLTRPHWCPRQLLPHLSPLPLYQLRSHQQAHQSHTIGSRTLRPHLLPPFPLALRNPLSHNRPN
ncbi:unnamed protein product, partial [Closterium sp. NIES-54]